MKMASDTRKDGSMRTASNRGSLFHSLQNIEPTRDTSEADRLKELENQLKVIKKTTKNPNSPSRFLDEVRCTKNGEVADNVEIVVNDGRIAEEEKTTKKSPQGLISLGFIFILFLHKLL